MPRRDEILEKVKTITALPAAAGQVLALLRDPNSSIGDIMSAIEFDPNLTADFLRLANSAFFAGPRRISTLREAGVLLGTARIQQLVLASAVYPMAMKPVRGYDLPPGQLLDRLVAVGVGAEELGRALGLKPPHYTFTAGLLHGIGKIVLGTFIEIDAAPILKLAFEEEVPFDTAERRILGIDHAETGAALLEHWNLPDEIVQVVRWYNRPEHFIGDTMVIDLVHYANILSIECGLGAGIDGLHYLPSPGVVERLHPKTVVAEQVTCRMLSELQSFYDQNPSSGGR